MQGNGDDDSQDQHVRVVKTPRVFVNKSAKAGTYPVKGVYHVPDQGFENSQLGAVQDEEADY